MTSDEKLNRDVRGMMFLLVPFAAVGLLAITLFSLSRDQVLQAFALSLAVAGAAAAVGAVFGFIFGIPRLLRATDQADPSTGDRPRGYQGNSNLEEISDWLTKLLLGATLAQASSLYGGLKQLAGVVASEFQPATGNVAYSGALIVFFAVFGFFLSYLLTRRVLPQVFRGADEDGASHIRAVSGKVDSAANSLMRARDTEAAAEEAEKKFGPAVDAVANVPRREVQPRDLATWAQAKMVKGDHLAATEALLDAKKVAPGDDNLVEMLVFSALYTAPPDGFEKAISAGEAVKEPSAWLHAYLAAAWGQKYKWAKENKQDTATPREKALAHVKAALAANDGVIKTLLQTMVNPPAGSPDDDLVALAGDDEELRKLLVPS